MAQPGVPSVGFGLKAGLNVAKLSDLQAVETIEDVKDEAKTGFVGGVHVKFPLGALRLQLEGLYSVKGAKGTSTLASAHWETKLTYLEIPLLLKYEFPIPVVSPFVYAGPSLGILLEAEEKNEVINNEWHDIKDGMEPTDWGLVVGGGAEIIGLTLEIRYTHGLSEASQGDLENSLVNKAKNRTFAVMAGIDFF